MCLAVALLLGSVLTVTSGARPPPAPTVLPTADVSVLPGYASSARVDPAAAEGSVVSTFDLVDNRSLPGATAPATQDGPTSVLLDPDNGNLYVRGYLGNILTVINGSSERVITSLGVPYFQNAYSLAESMAVDTSTGILYVDGSTSGNLTLVNGTTNSVVGTITLPGAPDGLAFDPTNGNLYVALWVLGEVVVVSGTSHTVVATIPVGSEPGAVLFDPASGQVFTANFRSDNVTVINTTHNDVVANLSTGVYPAALALDTDNDVVAVDNGADGGIGSVTLVNAATDAIVQNYTVGLGSESLAYAPVQNELFVPNGGSANVTVLNLTTGSPVASLPIGSGGSSVAYDPVNEDVYVPCQQTVTTLANVTVISAAQNRVVGNVTTASGNALDVAVDGSTGDAFVVNYGSYGLAGFVPQAEANVTVVSGSTNRALASIPLNVFPNGITYDPDVNELVVQDPGDSDSWLVNPTTGLVEGTLPSGYLPLISAYDPVQHELAVVSHGNYNLTVYDASLQPVARVTLGYSPTSIAYDPTDGDFYVADDLGGNLTVVNATTYTLGTPILVKAYDDFVALAYDHHDGDLFVANLESGVVTVVDPTDGTVVTNLTVGDEPDSVVVDPANDTVWVANSESGNITVFNDTTLRSVANLSVSYAGLLLYDPSNDLVYDASQGSGVADVYTFNASTYASGGPPIPLGLTFGADGLAYDPSNGAVYVTTQYAGAVSEISSAASYPVQFDETGLPSGTSWSVDLEGANNASVTPTVGFAVPNGSYEYTVPTVGVYIPVPSSGALDVDGSGQVVSVLFTQVSSPPSFPVSFEESGLPPATPWGVTLAGSPGTSTSPWVNFTEPNGTYAFTVPSVSGYTASPVQGNVSVQFGPAYWAIAFTPVAGPGEYSVAFLETGLSKGTTWNVTLAGTLLSASGPYLNFTERNGSYAFAVGSVAGYSRLPASGNVTVAGQAVHQTIVFSPIVAPLTATLAATPAALTLGASTELTTVASDGTAPYSYAYSGLPAGCLSANAASLVCTPTSAGTFTVTVTVTDAAGAHATATTTLTVAAAGTATTTSGGFSILDWLLVLVVIVVAAVLAVYFAARRRRRDPAADPNDRSGAGSTPPAPPPS